MLHKLKTWARSPVARLFRAALPFFALAVFLEAASHFEARSKDVPLCGGMRVFMYEDAMGFTETDQVPRAIEEREQANKSDWEKLQDRLKEWASAAWNGKKISMASHQSSCGG